MTTPQQLVELALAGSQSDRCIAIAQASESANLRWANNTLTTNGVIRKQTLTVIAFKDTSGGTAVGSVSGSVGSPEQVSGLVDAADAAAAMSKPAADAGPLAVGSSAEDWDDLPGATSIEVYANFAPALGDAFRHAKADGRVLYGFVDHDVTTTYLGSTTGLRLRHEQPTGQWGCTGKTADLSASAWVGGGTRDFTDVDATTIDSALADRLRWAQRRVDLPAGRYDTVLSPTAVTELMINAYWSAAARTALDGQSVFSRPDGGTRIGERLSQRPVHVFSDPADPQLGAIPFVCVASSSEAASVFDNGLPVGPTRWIQNGRLEALVQTRETAALSRQSVTPWADNLLVSVDDSEGTTEALVGDVARGLLVTCLWYIVEVDPQTLLLTGLTRDGVYLIEGGEITGAVNNFRFNESPISMLGRFTAASGMERTFSRELGDYFPRTATPALRVPDFNMSTVSRAT